ncbi:MAG TPA: hypothetical protein VGM93_03905 [Acidimicrobiales bacterium]
MSRRRGSALIVAVILVVSAGCASGAHSGAARSPSTAAHPTSARVRATTTATTAPATTTTTTLPPLPAPTVAARRAIFGAANVDAGGYLPTDRVIVSWLGIASLAASFDGQVVLLDTYLNNAPPATCTSGSSPSDTATVGYSRTSYDQLVALRPEVVFIGHGHFDHECLAGTIAATDGALLVGLPQDCALAQQQAARAGMATPVRCGPTVAADAPFGTTAQIQPLGPAVPITVVRHVHSGLASGAVQNTNGAESLLYVFHVGAFSLAWNDTVGPLREKAPAVLDVLKGLGPVDVEFGAILGLDVPEHGFRDPADYAQALAAKELFPLHHDETRAPGASTPFRGPMVAALAASPGARTTLHWLQDPTDYLRPLVFDPTAARWGH